MSSDDDLAMLAGIRDHLAYSDQLPPEEVAALAGQEKPWCARPGPCCAALRPRSNTWRTR